jgi:IgGFc binding protein
MAVPGCGHTDSGRASPSPTGPADSGETPSPPSDAARAPTDGAGFITLPDAATLPTAGEVTCADAAAKRGNAGCDFYAPRVPARVENGEDWCFAMFVVNPHARAVHLQLDQGGRAASVAQVARIPRGAGRGLTYAPYDEAQGLPSGDVAIVFLSGTCPSGAKAATDTASASAAGYESLESGLGQSFHLSSDAPVVAYQMIPYGGAGSKVTSATLLFPHESWGTSYFAGVPKFFGSGVIVVAAEDGTEVSFRPSGDVAAGTGVEPVKQGAAGKLTLAAGQFVNLTPGFTSFDGLSGTLVTANKSVGVFGATACFNEPVDKGACDSAHQQMPPFSALGQEYAAVRYRNRMPNVNESVPWQMVGAVDGTELSYAPTAPMGAPATLSAGQVVEFSSAEPFVVRSQSADHPFYLAGYMTGCTSVDTATKPAICPGDPEFVNVVPAAQYLSSYVFFTDPTYPETNLVVVRKRGDGGQFADVKLGCAAAPLSGWEAVGDYEYTRVDIVRGDFEPAIAGCDNGVESMTSDAPFGVTVWGWGSQEVLVGGLTTGFTSYAYPAGAGIQKVNDAPAPIPS